MKNKKLVVLSYISLEIWIYDYDENIWESPEDFQFEDEYVIHDNCHWTLMDTVKITMF